MFSLGNHDKEHERLIRLLQYQPQPVTTLPSATALPGQRVTYGSLDYYSDGTRWLSTQMFTAQMQHVTALAASAVGITEVDIPEDTASLYLIKMVFGMYLPAATTWNSTNTWTWKLNYQDTSGVNTQIGVTTDIWQTGRIVNRHYTYRQDINTVYSPATVKVFYMDWTKVSAPGNLNVLNPTLWYRLVGS